MFPSVLAIRHMTGDAALPLAISARGMRKTLGGKKVLDNVDLAVPAGSVLALLGPNGAGKTTTVSILATLLRCDAGEVTVAGHDLRREPGAVRAAIGVTGQFAAIDGMLTGMENLLLMGRLHHLSRPESRSRAAELTEQLGLGEFAGRRADGYSGGQQRRLDLAMSLMGKPRLVFLDEPTTGLDPRGRRDMWDAIGRLTAAGVTILLTTQYLEEADQLADRIAVLNEGRIVAEGTADELKALVPGARVELQFNDSRSLHDAASRLAGATQGDGGLSLSVPSDGSVSSVRDILGRLAGGTAVGKLSIHHPGLDDVFFALTSENTTAAKGEAQTR